MAVHARVVALLAAAAALSLAGCSAGGTRPASADDEAESPLKQYLSTVYRMDLDDEEAAARERAIEEIVASCMSDEGFEYTPRDPDRTVFAGEDFLPDDRDWVAQWGYGVVRWPGQVDVPETPGPSDNPNEAYIATLSESEAAAYDDVLYGSPPPDDTLTWTWEQQGCYGVATHEVDGDDPTATDEHRPIMTAIQDFYTARYDDPDPALADIDAEWADCMAGAGHDGFTAQTDASESIYTELSGFHDAQTTSVDDSPELDALHDEEVELALADLACREETDYAPRVQSLQWAAEERFIADHRAELDALVADVDARE